LETGLIDSVVSEKPERYHFIDGLRGLFSVVVLFFHVFFTFFGPWAPNYRDFGLFFDGSAAVEIFFVLSGFSLSIAYLSALAAPGKVDAERVIRRMAGARYIRLAIPCAVASLVMYAVVASGKNYFPQIPDEIKSPWWAWAYKTQMVSIAQTLKFSLYDIFLQPPFIPVMPYDGPYLITNLWLSLSDRFSCSVISSQ
jgi:peptidoglycan/LPS O-acetylase OafA/YrhL